jgi:hypothetical protein
MKTKKRKCKKRRKWTKQERENELNYSKYNLKNVVDKFFREIYNSI